MDGRSSMMGLPLSPLEELVIKFQVSSQSRHFSWLSISWPIRNCHTSHLRSLLHAIFWVELEETLFLSAVLVKGLLGMKLVQHCFIHCIKWKHILNWIKALSSWFLLFFRHLSWDYRNVIFFKKKTPFSVV